MNIFVDNLLLHCTRGLKISPANPAQCCQMAESASRWSSRSSIVRTIVKVSRSLRTGVGSIRANVQVESLGEAPCGVASTCLQLHDQHTDVEIRDSRNPAASLISVDFQTVSGEFEWTVDAGIEALPGGGLPDIGGIEVECQANLPIIARPRAGLTVPTIAGVPIGTGAETPGS